MGRPHVRVASSPLQDVPEIEASLLASVPAFLYPEE